VALDVPDSWGLAGKVAIVTGGGAVGDGIGNGRAAAILLARAGTKVVVVDRDLALAKRTVDESEESWRRLMTVNVDSMFLAAKHAIPAMRKTGGGAIVNVSSISALRPRGLTAYSVSKGAVIALTRAMAVDHGPEGIRGNCVAPGPVYTPMVYQRGMSPASRDRRRKASALGIEGTGWDIGHAVRFLFSDFARYITGHTLVVDGGTSLSAPERDAGGSSG